MSAISECPTGTPSGDTGAVVTALKACADSTATVASRQTSSSGGGSFKGMQKWSVPSMFAEDIEVCRQANGAPVELGRGGFCRVSARTPPNSGLSAWPLSDAAMQRKELEGTAVPQMRRPSHMRSLIQNRPADFSDSDCPERGARLDAASKGFTWSSVDP